MKMADVLHKIADLLDQTGDESNRPENSATSGEDFQHDVADGADKAGAGDVEVGVMIPPLQQKLEILKKTAGMDNAMDSGSDELDDIKKLTGIKAVVQHVAGEDNDIVG